MIKHHLDSIILVVWVSYTEWRIARLQGQIKRTQEVIRIKHPGMDSDAFKPGL